VLLASSASCGDVARLVRPGPTLVLPEVSAGVRLDDAQRHVPYSFDDVPLCLDEAGSVTVDRIELANPTGGLELRRFSVRSTEAGEYMSYLQDQRTTLTAAGYPSEGPFTVDDVCFDHREEESDDPISLLGFEVERGDESADGAAYSTGLVVHYTSGGQERSAFVGFAVLLCPGKATRRPDCDVHEVRPPD
jgi:hypothetical protein